MTQCIAKPLPPHVQGVFNVICPLSHWSALVFSTTNHAHNHYSLQITVTFYISKYFSFHARLLCMKKLFSNIQSCITTNIYTFQTTNTLPDFLSIPRLNNKKWNHTWSVDRHTQTRSHMVRFLRQQKVSWEK